MTWSRRDTRVVQTPAVGCPVVTQRDSPVRLIALAVAGAFKASAEQARQP